MINDQMTLSRFSNSSDELEKERILKHSKNYVEEPIWFPLALQQVLEWKEEQPMPVIYYEKSHLEKLIRNLIMDQSCGITVIKRPQSKPIVCFTTKQNIVVMDLCDNTHIDHMRSILKKGEFIFFVMHGTTTADLLKGHGIHIKNFVDLVTFDIHIRLRTHFLERAPVKGKYFLTYIHQDIKIEPADYKRLAEKWMDFRLDDNDGRDYSLLERQPFDIKAENVIRKSAALTRAIGNRMWDEFDKMHQSRKNQIFSLGIEATNVVMEEYRRTEDPSWDHLVTCLNQGTSNSDRRLRDINLD